MDSIIFHTDIERDRSEWKYNSSSKYETVLWSNANQYGKWLVNKNCSLRWFLQALTTVHLRRNRINGKLTEYLSLTLQINKVSDEFYSNRFISFFIDVDNTWSSNESDRLRRSTTSCRSIGDKFSKYQIIFHLVRRAILLHIFKLRFSWYFMSASRPFYDA